MNPPRACYVVLIRQPQLVERPTQRDGTRDLGHDPGMSLQVKISYYGREDNELSVAWLYLTCVGRCYNSAPSNAANPFCCQDLVGF